MKQIRFSVIGGLLVAGILFLASCGGFGQPGPGSSLSSSPIAVVTIKTNSAESMIRHARRRGALVQPIEKVPTSAEEMRYYGLLCLAAFINNHNMGGPVSIVAAIKRAGQPFKAICISQAPPTESYSIAVCKRAGLELAAIRPEAREVDCKLPLPPGAKSA